MALAHKGLDHDTRPTRFTEIGAIAGDACRTLPALQDGEQLVVDSHAIALHLEQAYPDRPSLFDGPGGVAVTRFVENWCAGTLHPALFPIILLDLFDHVAEQDRAYFRASREQRLGRKLEEVAADREQRLDGFRATLQPLRLTLAGSPFIGGDGPLYADYVVFGALQWARAVSPTRLLADEDPVKAWFERCLDAHDGLGRNAPGYD
jgi:glutathione S-transferase